MEKIFASMSPKAQQNILLALFVTFVFACCGIVFKAIHWLMWAAYYAGFPM